MPDQPMSEQLGLPAAMQMELINALHARQNPQGMTQIAPQVPNVQVPQPRPFTPRQQSVAQPGNNRQSLQNLGVSASNLVGQISEKLQQRKARENQQVFDRFSQSVAGARQAQAQLQQAQQMNQQAMQEFQQATDPQAKQAAAMKLKQSSQMLTSAQHAMAQNKQILDDMFNGPKGDKHAKLLSKGFGIDDKNANTPERQHAIQSIQKSMGVGGRAAGIISQLPQTMQLSPEAQQQQLMQQAGIQGKPLSQDQAVRSATTMATKQVDQALKQEQIANSAGLKTQGIIDKLPSQGLKAVQNPDGSYQRNPDGTLKTENMTPSELAKNPELYEKYLLNKARIDSLTAQAQASTVRARAAMIRANTARQTAQMAQDPNAIANWSKLVTDPASGVTLAQVPAAARGKVVNQVAAEGKKIVKPLTGDEFKRADLANNAVDNIDHALEIWQRRPDLFGPAGWGKTKFEMALAGGDPDAVDFLADIRLANLPAVGIHGVRGKWAIEDIQKLDGNLYLNFDSMGNVLHDIHRSASEFAKMGGRRDMQTGGQSSPSNSNVIVVSPEDMK